MDNYDKSEVVSVIEFQNPGFDDLPQVLYSPVVGGKKLSCAAESRDIALLLGIEYKHQGLNSQFTKMAVRMLQIDSKWAE